MAVGCRCLTVDRTEVDRKTNLISGVLNDSKDYWRLGLRDRDFFLWTIDAEWTLESIAKGEQGSDVDCVLHFECEEGCPEYDSRVTMEDLKPFHDRHRTIVRLGDFSRFIKDEEVRECMLEKIRHHFSAAQRLLRKGSMMRLM